MALNKSGGIWFWRVGRIGGSFYVAKARKPTASRVIAELATAAVIGIPMGLYAAFVFTSFVQ